ncbi:MAG: hypothetical protein H6702_22715 [Myxococcales bacterium]|nr:hypothetical protein [Myxococcales bacterium]
MSLLLTVSSAHARCASGATATWPPASAAVGPQPLLVVDLHGTHKDRAAAPGALRLTVGGRPVAFTEAWRTVGDRMLQIALRPAALQPKGAELRLSLPVAGQRTVIARWTVGEAPLAPTWPAPPTLARALAHVDLGCAPARQAFVATGLGDQPGDPTAFVVEVAGHTALISPAADGTLEIGAGMCSGPFKLDPKGDYTATLRPIGAAGTPGEPRRLRLR